MKTVPLVLAACVLLTACGGRSEPEPGPAEQPPSVFDPLTDTLDRAEGVEQTLSDSAAERRRQLEEAEGR